MSNYRLIKTDKDMNPIKGITPLEYDTISECEVKATSEGWNYWRILSIEDNKNVLSSYHVLNKMAPVDKPIVRFLGSSVSVGDELNLSESFSMKRGEKTICRFLKPDGFQISQMCKDFSPAQDTTYYLSKVKVYSITKYGVSLEVIKLNKVGGKKYLKEDLNHREVSLSRMVINIKRSNNKGLFL